MKTNKQLFEQGIKVSNQNMEVSIVDSKTLALHDCFNNTYHVYVIMEESQ